MLGWANHGSGLNQIKNQKEILSYLKKRRNISIASFIKFAAVIAAKCDSS